MNTKLLPTGLMVIEGDQWLSKWVEETGRLDHDAMIAEKIVPRLRPGDWVIDAGAAIGDHTVAYAKAVGEKGAVFAYEPNHVAVQCLKHNSQGYHWIHIIESPLSDGKPEKLNFKYSDNVFASHLEPDLRWYSDGIVSESIDSREWCRMDYIKVDVEGMELKAIRGAEKTLAKFKPLLFVELNRGTLKRMGISPEYLVGVLDGMGYKPEWLDPGHGVHNDQVDCFFVHIDNPR